MNKQEHAILAEKIYFLSGGPRASLPPGFAAASSVPFLSPPASTGRDSQQFDLFHASDQTEINLNSSEIEVRKSRQDRQG